MSETIVVSVAPKDPKNFARRKEVQRLLSQDHRKALACAGVAVLYKLEGSISRIDIERIVREILWDPIVEIYAIDEAPADRAVFADVWFKAGVADPVGESVQKAALDLDIAGLARANSGTRYKFSFAGKNMNGKGSFEVLGFASRELLNPLIQECRIIEP